MKNTIKIFFAMAFCIMCTGTAMAQNTKADKKAEDIAELKRIVESKNYVFKATAAQPTVTAGVRVSGASALPNNVLNQLNSGMINLTSSYDVKLSNDTLTAFLPYYGQSYTAPINAADGGIKLTTTKFDYTVKEKKKGNLQITFKPEEMNIRTPGDVYRMVLTVSPGGYATLQVISVNRSPISFTGMLQEVQPKTSL